MMHEGAHLKVGRIRNSDVRYLTDMGRRTPSPSLAHSA